MPASDPDRPVVEQVRRDARADRELGLRLTATLETHVHADHVTGAALLKGRTGSRIVVAKGARRGRRSHAGCRTT